MEFKGTKGKWIVEENKYIIRKENNDWLCVLYHTNYINKKEAKANAQLIAHSPLLLEAIKDSIEELRERGLFNMANYHEKLYNQCVTF